MAHGLSWVLKEARLRRKWVSEVRAVKGVEGCHREMIKRSLRHFKPAVSFEIGMGSNVQWRQMMELYAREVFGVNNIDRKDFIVCDCSPVY